MSDKLPEHAARIETPRQIFNRTKHHEDVTDTETGVLVGITIDRDQIRRALGMALIGEAEMPRDALARVRKVLEKIGGPL